MSIFSKIRVVTLAYSNNLLDKAVDMNSIPVVKQYIRDLEDAIEKTNHESAVATANVSVLQAQIDNTSTLIGTDTERAKAFLARSDDANARLVATRIHDNQVLLASLREQIGQATTNAQQLNSALGKMRAKHDEMMNQMRILESQDRQAHSLDSATKSLKAAAALTSNDVSGSVDNLAQKIHLHAATANEEFNRAVGAFDGPSDPLKDAAVDDILASLRVPETKAAD